MIINRVSAPFTKLDRKTGEFNIATSDLAFDGQKMSVKVTCTSTHSKQHKQFKRTVSIFQINMYDNMSTWATNCEESALTMLNEVEDYVYSLDGS